MYHVCRYSQFEAIIKCFQNHIRRNKDYSNSVKKFERKTDNVLSDSCYEIHKRISIGFADTGLLNNCGYSNVVLFPIIVKKAAMKLEPTMSVILFTSCYCR